MKERYKSNKKYKGMTLLEILVVIIIIGILLGPILGMMITNIQLSIDANNKSSAKDISVLIQDYTFKKLNFAEEVMLANAPAPLGATTQSIFINANGDFVHRKQGVDDIIFTQKAIGNCKIQLEAKKDTTSSKMIEYKVMAKDMQLQKDIYITTKSMIPDNMEAGSAEIQIEVPTQTTYSVISFKTP